MKHLGDITKINGAEIPVVDCITGGSPCQDLSVAGKRAGLAGERSGLFMEQMRIVKEMRENDRAAGRAGYLVRPRYMVWENVPGAFSSGAPKGADFAAVLEEVLKVCEPGADVHVCTPPRGWPKAGCFYSDHGAWSLAWRVHDAQFWGVPQRRKRIALVADFGGLSAPEILFERRGLRGDTAEGEQAREETAGTAGSGASYTVRIRGGCDGGGKGALIQAERSGALGCNQGQTVFCLKGNAIDRDTAQNGGWVNEDKGFSLDATDRHGVAIAGFKFKASGTAGGIGWQEEVSATQAAGQPMAVYDAQGNGNGEVSPTVTGRVSDYTALCIGNGQTNNVGMSETANCLDTMHDQQAVMTFGLDSNKNGYTEQAGALASRQTGGATECCCDRRMTVRRLTPLECERLQGFPDCWTDIGDWTDSRGRARKASDSARYKALGNSIALPFWFWLLRRISAQYERPATLGSLFDGIGGFPLCWEWCNGKGTALWASEIEEFPIAVTKRRFGE